MRAAIILAAVLSAGCNTIPLPAPEGQGFMKPFGELTYLTLPATQEDRYCKQSRAVNVGHGLTSVQCTLWEIK